MEESNYLAAEIEFERRKTALQEACRLVFDGTAADVLESAQVFYVFLKGDDK